MIREQRPVGRWIGNSAKPGSASLVMRNEAVGVEDTDVAVAADNDVEVTAVGVGVAVDDAADVIDMA